MLSAYDITIVGSGIVGATMALALAKQTNLKIAVVESQPQPKQAHRVSAISLASSQIWQNLNCFERIKEKQISPYTKMHVWDAEGQGKIDFDCRAVCRPALGYIIEDSVIREGLLEQFSHYENIDFLCPLKFVKLRETVDSIDCISDTHPVLQTKLLIAADGANSWVRETMNIEIKTRDYQQTAIVTAVYTEKPHEAIARQRFLRTGPLAFLPLSHPNHCSIVWSTTPDEAATLLALTDDAFCKALGDAFANCLGEITAVSPRAAFPLRMRHAKQYVRERLALIGDAAHTIHPLAGQGVNLGLLDAVTLADVITTAHERKRNFASLVTLRRYERSRKSDTVAMLAMVDMLKNLFASESKSVRYLRNSGLSITNKLSYVKNFFTSYALGLREGLPKLARY